MNVRILFLAGLAAGLLTAGAAVAEEAASSANATSQATGTHGEKEWKQRINVVARKPLNHDIPYLDSRDRSGWREFNTWQGVRDERPIIARKSLGFHAPDPHRPRAERVLLIGRGPLRGPAPTE